MKLSLLRPGRVVAGVLSATLVGRYGIPLLALLGFLALVGIAAACWILNNKDRSLNLSRILYAKRGDSRSLDPHMSGGAQQGRRRSRVCRSSRTAGHHPSAIP